VQDYGAKGDGSTDDTSAIQAALDTQRNVYFGNTGNPYIINTALKYYGNTHIYSNGATIKNTTGLSTPYTMMEPNSSSESNVTIDGLRFNQLASTYGYDANSYCVSVSEVNNILVTNCTFEDIITMAVWFDDTGTTTKNVGITNNTILSSEAGGFSLFGYFDGVLISDNRIYNCKDDAIALQSSSTSYGDSAIIANNIITDCHTQNSSSSTPRGIHTLGIPNVTITGNTINSTYGCSIYVWLYISHAQTNTVIADNVCVAAGTNNGGATPASGVYVNVTAGKTEPSHISITGNSIYNPLDDGITAIKGNFYSIVGNTVKDSGTAGIGLEDVHDSVVVGNVVENAGQENSNEVGIYLIDDCDDNIILGNRCEGSGITNYGIAVSHANGANNIIAHNNVSGVDTAGISDSGTGTQVFGNIGFITENRGSASDTTDGSGNIVIAHGLAVTPNYVSVHVVGDNTYDADIQLVDATNITVRIKDSTDNSDVTATAVNVYWAAEN